MTRIIIFGVTEVNLEGIEDPSTQVILVGTKYDYEDENTTSINDKNILEYYQSENLEELDEPITFVDCTGFSKNYLDVMYRLQTTRFDKRTYLVGPSANEEIELLVKDLKFQTHFNPFDGDEMPKSLDKLDKTYLKTFFKNCSMILSYYLKCGFHKKEILDIPPGWSMNLAGKELNALIRYYGLLPIAPDVTPIIDFTQNSQYREIVTQTLLSVTSNFVVRNKIVNVAEVEDWTNPEIWEMISSRL